MFIYVKSDWLRLWQLFFFIDGSFSIKRKHFFVKSHENIFVNEHNNTITHVCDTSLIVHLLIKSYSTHIFCSDAAFKTQ